MEESEILFDDKELDELEGEEGEILEPIVDEKTQREIEKEIDDILEEISTQI